MTDRKLMQQALEALDRVISHAQEAEDILLAALSEGTEQPQRTHWEGCEEVHPECRKPERERRHMWSDSLVCHWISWTIEWDGFLRLDLPKDNCCNMRGAIKTAEAICPMVFRIDVYAGGKLDVTYSRANAEAKWMSIDRRHRVEAKLNEKNHV